MHPARSALILALFCLPIAACVPSDVPEVSDGPSTASCGADGLAAYIGRPATSLPASGPWGAVRVIRPGMMVTMDYSATRLNVHVDGAGKILKLTCG
ncbi:MAG: I78 family peptidase inhibitor [Cypionkella sp.]